MPIPSSISTLFRENLEKQPFLYVETESDDVQDALERVVEEYVREHDAIYTTDFDDGQHMATKSIQNQDVMHVVYIRNWHRFSGNDVMLRYNLFFEEDMRRYGPDSWDSETTRVRLGVWVEGRGYVPVGTAKNLFENVKIVFSGLDTPMRDEGLYHRLLSYRIQM